MKFNNIKENTQLILPASFISFIKTLEFFGKLYGVPANLK